VERTRIHKLGHLLCLIAIIGILDVHTYLYQGWAWATMLYDRIPDQGIEHAINTTFSGEAPCEKCLAIQRLKQEKERKPTPLNSDKELKLKITPLPRVAKFYQAPAPNRLSYPSLNQLLPPSPLLPIIDPPPQSV